MEEKKGLTIKDLLIRIILIIIFIFLLIWLFPMPDLKPLNNQIFADNIDRMKNVAKTYYTVERLPKDINSSKRMTLKEMLDKKLILPLMDSNGKYCSEKNSYVEITKLENEYIIKVYLSCSDKQDYIIEHYGCYDICSDTCKALETTSTSGYASNITTKKPGKTTTKKITTKAGKIYEYEFVRNECSEIFDKWVCQKGYNLVGEMCMKQGAKTVSYPAEEKIVESTSTDEKPAEVITNSKTVTTDASCRDDYVTSTINAGYKKTTYSAQQTITTKKVTANKVISYDVKGAVATTTTTNSSYKLVQNYDVINADKYATGYKWTWVATVIDRKSDLAYVNDNEKMVLIDQWAELYCENATACASTVTYYMYYKYKKEAIDYKYSCDAYPGYSLYDGNKCRRAVGDPVKQCPDKYEPNGSVCTKTDTSYSCSKYGSDYKLDENKKTCTKEIVSYNCNNIGKTTSDPKYCSKEVTTYSCPTGTEPIEDGKKCVLYHDYYCPANTSTKTYTLNGTKCTVKTKVKVCSCDSGYVQTEDKLHCVKTDKNTTYSCDKYGSDYKRNGSKCVKTIVTQKKVPSCEKYEGTTLSGTSCVKTVNTTDSKKAEKSYKPSCEKKYKWSTNTSLDGWTYTGNKRAVN